MTANRAVLMSVKPEFASRILDGSKTIELRRQMPRVAAGDIVVLYVSSPVKELVATFEIEAIQSGKPNNLWHLVEAQAGLSRREYDNYFDGAKQAVGIVLRNMRRPRTPLSLTKLRDLIQGFTVPQSYRFLCDVERSALGI